MPAPSPGPDCSVWLQVESGAPSTAAVARAVAAARARSGRLLVTVSQSALTGVAAASALGICAPYDVVESLEAVRQHILAELPDDVLVTSAICLGALPQPPTGCLVVRARDDATTFGWWRAWRASRRGPQPAAVPVAPGVSPG